MNGFEKVSICIAITYFALVVGISLILWRLEKMAVDLTAQFATLDAAIAALPARIAAAEAAAAANQIQPADVQAAADSRAASVNAIAAGTTPAA